MSHVRRKPIANKKGTDHLRSLISAFVVCCFDSLITKVAVYTKPSFWATFGAEQAGLSYLVAPSEDRFFSWCGCHDFLSINIFWNARKVLKTWACKKRASTPVRGVQPMFNRYYCNWVTSEKTCFSHMRTTKVQISLRIRAVWSAPLLFTT